MEQALLQKQILSKLEGMEKRLNYVITYIEDSKLSEEVRPEYIEKLKKIQKQKGKTFKTKEELMHYLKHEL